MRAFLFFPHYNDLQSSSSLRSPQVAHGLKDRGVDVVAFAPGTHQRKQVNYPELRRRLYASYDDSGVKLVRIRTVQRFRKNALSRLVYEVMFAFSGGIRALLMRKPDVVVVAYPPNVMPIVGLALSKLWRVPFVLEARDLVADAVAESNYVKSNLFVAIARWVEKTVVQHATQVVSVSKGINKHLVSHTPNTPEKFSVVPIGYAAEVFDNADLNYSPREQYGWGERFVVVYTGAITPAYDIPTLLRAANRLKDDPTILFVIVGNGEDKAKYVHYCDEYGLINCQFIDYQPRVRIPAILRDAQLGVHLFRDDPMWAYVLGNKGFDYLGSGTPMIYAGTGDTAELIVECSGGVVVKPEDDAELAVVVKELSIDAEKVRLMGESAKSYIQEYYDAGQVQDVFYKALLRATGDSEGEQL